MPKEIFIVKQPNNAYYLVEKVDTTDIYQRAKQITDFIEKETKKLEYVINAEIKTLLRQKGINILENTENEFKRALSTLKTDFHETLDIIDIYRNAKLENCEIVGITKGQITVVLEDNKYLQCGLAIKEVEIV